MKKMHPRLDNQKTLPFQALMTEPEKETDLKLALYVATHSAVNSVDHLCEILEILGRGTKSLEQLKLHRTKCSNLIKHVIAPCFLTELIADIGNMWYSLIIDESTDVSIVKYLFLCIKYFSEKKQKITTEYLGNLIFYFYVRKCTYKLFMFNSLYV